jgi:hypothetical protein
MGWRDDSETDGYGPDLDDEEEDDAEADTEDDQLPCPSCGNLIYDDTDRCPHCGDWVMPLAAAAAGHGHWIWWTALVLAVVLFVTWGVFG